MDDGDKKPVISVPFAELAPERVVLDIGGGPDINYNASPEYFEERLERSRALRLARHDSSTARIVFDPSFNAVAAEKISAVVPNISFVEGFVEPGHKLPYENGSLGGVEISHLFRPLAVQQIEPAFKSELKGHQGISQAVSKALELIESGKPEVLDYTFVMSEAARVLKLAGRLVIAEKKEVIDIILRTYGLNLGGQSEIVSGLGLKFIGVEDNNDEFRSVQAEAYAMNSEFAYQNGDTEEAEERKPMLLIFEKLK